MLNEARMIRTLRPRASAFFIVFLCLSKKILEFGRLDFGGEVGNLVLRVRFLCDCGEKFLSASSRVRGARCWS